MSTSFNQSGIDRSLDYTNYYGVDEPIVVGVEL